jgi:hypothetical protein
LPWRFRPFSTQDAANEIRDRIFDDAELVFCLEPQLLEEPDHLFGRETQLFGQFEYSYFTRRHRILMIVNSLLRHAKSLLKEEMLPYTSAQFRLGLPRLMGEMVHGFLRDRSEPRKALILHHAHRTAPRTEVHPPAGCARTAAVVEPTTLAPHETRQRGLRETSATPDTAPQRDPLA